MSAANLVDRADVAEVENTELVEPRDPTAPCLDYATVLERGWPIATGVIEGACRHIVKDRMDITGARWELEGAEAVLRPRAPVANGDFNDYWRFHLSREQECVHLARYATPGLAKTA